MWRHNRGRSLVFEGNEDLTCVICQNLLVDACAGTCGCKYCFKCISDYNINRDKHCPGNKEYCNDNNLDFGREIIRNEILNKRVSKVKVNCPNTSCDRYIELIQLDEHLRLCKKQLMECPYNAIGCVYEKGNGDSIITHLDSDTLIHTGLLLELIENMKNEINGLKEGLEKKQLEETEKRNNEMEDLRQFIEESRIEKENLVTMVNDIRKDMNVKFENDKLEETENRNKELEKSKAEKENIVIIMDDLRRDLNANMEKNKLEIATLKKESIKQNNKMFQLERQMLDERKVTEEITKLESRLTKESSKRERDMDEQRRQNDDAKIEREKTVDEVRNQLIQMIDEMKIIVGKETKEINKYIEEQRRKNNDVRIDKMKRLMYERKKYDEDRDRRMNRWIKWNKLLPNIDADFVWRIDQCSKKIDKGQWSESFYSNNYKFCLNVSICSDDCILLGCRILKGDNDDKVEWPMKQSVTLAIIDQCTLMTHKTQTYKYDTYCNTRGFCRSTSDINDGIGSYSFIKYSSIKDNASIISDDSMIVSFVIND